MKAQDSVRLAWNLYELHIRGEGKSGISMDVASGIGIGHN
jgi:hypothetical protein